MHRHTSEGHPYLPDGAVDKEVRKPISVGRSVVLFMLSFALLQWGWNTVRGTWVERVVIHEITVAPAAALVRLITPEVAAKAVGPRIKAPGGGINILNGCEGTEVMYLLIAAFITIRLPWRIAGLGLLIGLGWVFVLNQARIVVLFYAFRSSPTLFDLLHTAVLPAVLVALTAAYFYAALHFSQKRVA